MAGEGTSSGDGHSAGALAGALEALMHHGPPNGCPRRHSANLALAHVLRALAAREKARGKKPFVDVVDDACHALLRRRLRTGRPRFLEVRHPAPRTDAEATHYLTRALRNAQLEFLRRGDFGEARPRAPAREPEASGLAGWPTDDVADARRALAEHVLPQLGLRSDARSATEEALEQLIAMRLAARTPRQVAHERAPLDDPPDDATPRDDKRARDRLHQRWSRALERVARWTHEERQRLVDDDNAVHERWDRLLLVESLIGVLAPRGTRHRAKRPEDGRAAASEVS